jgi:hypothetical protein
MRVPSAVGGIRSCARHAGRVHKARAGERNGAAMNSSMHPHHTRAEQVAEQLRAIDLPQ